MTLINPGLMTLINDNWGGFLNRLTRNFEDGVYIQVEADAID